ncbi:MAG TPA: Tm-1-like ATP-binding domain-containing protein [Pirellulales bacterium]|jgi:uncharacterized protein (UPF0261 family)|nr:Tm-1-like ATP-binding domain-containing protein [Pirellulales bacterium]
MRRTPSVHLLAALDTKGIEAAFVRDVLRQCGVACTVVDCGCLASPAIEADIPRDAVFAAAGESVETLRTAGDRGTAVAAAAAGAARVIADRHAAGLVAGVFGLGGSAGTTIATAAMRALPIGLPKLMVSTLASGQVRQYVGDKDIAMVNSIVDIAGVNRISRPILANAALAMAGMVTLSHNPPTDGPPYDKPLVAATMFGVTTPCVQRAREVLEMAGYEVLVFHATGNGGRAMEALVAERLVAGVLDITTTELADELVGGMLSAGPDRLTAAGQRGVPQVVSVGALDMVNFLGLATVPERFRSRLLYRHNANVTLMRTTVEENVQLGAEIGRKLATAQGPTAVLLPQRGVSALDREGQPFDDPAARQALFSALRSAAGSVPVEELDLHINDAAFADAAAARLLALMKSPVAR